jgi:Sulfotransferase family
MTGSPDRPLRVFLVGCPRSGTTWLQLLLSQHADVVTTQETHLFSRYISRIEKGWLYEKRPREDDDRGTGLATLMSDAQFYALCREFADRILDRITVERPDACVVLEKTPAHVRHADLIRNVYPDARFIHLIRDPRSVVSSLRAAGRSWGRGWAPTSIIAGSRIWNEDVRAGRAIGLATEAYHELRYEDLKRDGAAALGAVFAFIGIDVDAAFCERALEACSLSNLRQGGDGVRSAWSLRTEPGGFYRKGDAAGWRDELSGRDVALIEHIAGDLMAETGYARVSRRRRRAPLRLRIRDALRWRTDAASDWVRERIERL